MTDTIVIARDMIRQLEDKVNTCDSKVPLMVYSTIHRVEDAFNEQEIDYNTQWDEKNRIEKLATKFNEKCACRKFIL